MFYCARTGIRTQKSWRARQGLSHPASIVVEAFETLAIPDYAIRATFCFTKIPLKKIH